MWDLPRPGLEPVSPSLAGGFLTTVPPGKSLVHQLLTTLDFNYMLAPLGENRKVSSETELVILKSYIVRALEMIQ